MLARFFRGPGRPSSSALRADQRRDLTPTPSATAVRPPARGGAEGHGLIVGVQQPVELGTAGFHAFREARPGQVLVVHQRVELPRDHPLDRARGDLFMEALLFQEIVERRSDPCFRPGHAICFLRFNTKLPLSLTYQF